MSRWITRALLPTELCAFTAFERHNRQAYEHFNEPHHPVHYTDAGLAQAFQRMLARQAHDHCLTRITTAEGSNHWVAKGSLTVHGRGGVNAEPFGRLVYQTDRLYRRQGAGHVVLADLIGQARRMRLLRVEALIAVDNAVSLHLLRRAGFCAAGWDSPAQLLRGPIACLRLGRAVRSVESFALAGTHVELPT